MNYLKPTILISILLVLCSSIAYADVVGHVTVTWDIITGNYYSGTICVEDTSIFGAFSEILVLYSYSDHSAPPAPNSVSLAEVGTNRYCAALTPSIWDSTPTADTVYGAKITIKHPSCDNGMCYEDDPWYVDVPNDLNDPTHLFRWIGGAKSCTDGDNDNYNISSPGCGVADCDDGDADAYPGADEVVADGIDQDCDGFDDCYQDSDGDSYGSTTIITSNDLDCADAGESDVDTDCDDAASTCTIDCITDIDGDGVIDCLDLCMDVDYDDYGTDNPVSSCTIDGSTPCTFGDAACIDTDCDDTDDTVYPGATDDPGDDTDDNCDGFVVCYDDADSDGYGTTTGGESTFTATGGVADVAGACGSNDADNWDDTNDDCDDIEPTMFPNNPEICDGLDNDCDTVTDEGGNLCTAYDLPGIATCTNSPDDVALTWDYRAAYTSSCTSGSCTQGTNPLTHACDITNCAAECETNSDCANKCEAQVYYYSGACQSGCTCSFTTEDCDTHDGWVNTTNLQWVNTSLCAEKEQKQQQYQDYGCVAVSGCEFTVTQSRWVDTGAARNIADNTVCGPKDVCSAGTCIGIACFNKAHCGADGPVGPDYCNNDDDVYQDYITFTCNDAQTITASCTNLTTQEQQDDCHDTNEFCEDAACYPRIDLSIDRIDVSRTRPPVAGGLTLVRFVLDNNEPNSVSNIEYTIETDSPDTNPVYNIPSIDAATQMKIWSSWIYANSGTYTAKIILDPDDNIRETDETNNEQTFTVDVSR